MDLTTILSDVTVSSKLIDHFETLQLVVYIWRKMERVDDVSGVVAVGAPISNEEFGGRGWNFDETDRSRSV
jgi:hypothetical protein